MFRHISIFFTLTVFYLILHVPSTTWKVTFLSGKSRLVFFENTFISTLPVYSILILGFRCLLNKLFPIGCGILSLWKPFASSHLFYPHNFSKQNSSKWYGAKYLLVADEANDSSFVLRSQLLFQPKLFIFVDLRQSIESDFSFFVHRPETLQWFSCWDSIISFAKFQIYDFQTQSQPLCSLAIVGLSQISSASRSSRNTASASLRSIPSVAVTHHIQHRPSCLWWRKESEGNKKRRCLRPASVAIELPFL